MLLGATKRDWGLQKQTKRNYTWFTEIQNESMLMGDWTLLSSIKRDWEWQKANYTQLDAIKSDWSKLDAINAIHRY